MKHNKEIKKDKFAVIYLQVADIKELRPRWSVNRCRKWLMAHENNLLMVMETASAKYVYSHLE
jgi:hypothetical protein